MTDTQHTPHPRPTATCATFAALLPVLEDPGIEAHEAAQARTHLATCAYCQAQLANYERLGTVMRRYMGPSETPKPRTEEIPRGIQEQLTLPTAQWGQESYPGIGMATGPDRFCGNCGNPRVPGQHMCPHCHRPQSDAYPGLQASLGPPATWLPPVGIVVPGTSGKSSSLRQIILW